MDVKATALGGLKGAFHVFLLDLEALPEDAFDKSFGGKARTIADLVYEVNLVNDHVGLNLRGEPLFDWPEGWIFAPEAARTKDAVLQSFKTSSERILATIEDMTEEDLEATIQTGQSGNHPLRALPLHDTPRLVSQWTTQLYPDAARRRQMALGVITG